MQETSVMTKGDGTRQRIIEQAAQIFNQKGYEGASLSALMEATGLRKGGIYRHFASKEELATEAFDYAWQAARDARVRGLDTTAPALDQLKQLIANFVDRRGRVPGGCPLLNTAVDADDGNPMLLELARKALADWERLLIRITKAGIAQGEIRSDVEPESVATIIISLLEGALMISRLDDAPTALRVVQGHLNGVLDGLRVPAAKPTRRRLKGGKTTSR
jgi:TetR/AcrR family transcriptional repressor of nem operon